MSGNSITLSFTNNLDSPFTLGKLNDGFPSPSLSQDMLLAQAVASPLGATTQTIFIEQEATAVDALKDMSVVGSLAANPNGCAAVSVVWTNYTLSIRFGISAAISTNRLDSVEGTLGSIAGFLGVNAPSPVPTITWAYMMDSTPDQPVAWNTPASLVAPMTNSYPAQAQYQVIITPTVNDFSLVIDCQVQSLA